MSKALNNIIKVSLAVTLLTSVSYAGFKEHYDLGLQYLSNYQYAGAITEFKSALRINYLDNSARIGLINSYLARGMYYGKTDHNYQKAADDYRSALFYMLYYPLTVTSAQAIPQATANLNKCLNSIQFDSAPSNRFETAKQLRAEGNFSAAGYEFNQALADRNFQKDSFEQVGDIMKLLGNNQKAAEYYRKAIAVAPNNVPLRLSYAKMLDSLGSDDAAVQEYNYILSKTSDNKEVLYSLERIYKKKLENSPSDPDITANLGAIMQKQGKYDDALMYYQKSEYLNPANTNTRLNVGTLYQQKGDYKTALKAYESVLILYPDNINANLYKAQAESAMGDDSAALNSYRKVVALDPGNVDAQTQMLNLLKKSMTMVQFTDYVKKNMAASNTSELFYNYALDLHKQNKFDDAIVMYREALNINSQNPEMFLNLAIAQNQAGNPEAALVVLQGATQKFPGNKEITDAISGINEDIVVGKLKTAATFFDNKDYQSAMAEYAKILPQTVDSLLGMASSYQALGDNKNAIVYYQKAFQKKPTDSEIAYYIGALYAEEEDFNNAKAYLNKAVVLNKNNKKALEFLKSVNEQLNSDSLNSAIALYDAGKYDESLPILNQIIASDASNAYAFYYRGMINDVKTKRVEAINDFKKAYSLNKEFEIVNYMIAVAYDALGNKKEAYRSYNHYATSTAQDDEYKKYAKTRVQELKQYAN